MASEMQQFANDQAAPHSKPDNVMNTGAPPAKSAEVKNAMPTEISFACDCGESPEENMALLQANEYSLGRMVKLDPKKPIKEQFQATYAVTDHACELTSNNRYGSFSMYKGSSIAEVASQTQGGVAMDFSLSYAFFSAKLNMSVNSESQVKQKSQSETLRCDGFQIIKTTEVDLSRLCRHGKEQEVWNKNLTGGNGPELFMHENGHHFVQKVFIGGKYKIKVDLTWTSTEGRSKFDMEFGGGGEGGFGLVKVAASLKGWSKNESQFSSSKLDITAKATALGGDLTVLNTALYKMTPSNMYDVIQEGMTHYFDSLEKHGAVVSLDICAIGPGNLQALANLKIAPTVALEYTSRLHKSFACLRDCEKMQAIMMEKRLVFAKIAAMGGPGGTVVSEEYTTACNEIEQRLELARQIFRLLMMLPRGEVEQSGDNRGMPRMMGKKESDELFAEEQKDEKNNGEDRDRKKYSPALQGLINLSKETLKIEWDKVAEIKPEWEVLTGYGQTTFTLIDHATLSQVSPTKHEVYWTGPLLKGVPIGVPTFITVLPSKGAENGSASTPADASPGEGEGKKEKQQKKDNGGKKAQKNATDKNATDKNATDKGDKNATDKHGMAKHVYASWVFKIPGIMYKTDTKTLDEKVGVAQSRDQSFQDPRTLIKWDRTKLPKDLMQHMKYYGKKVWELPNFVTVTYEGLWENAEFHGDGALEFRWQEKGNKFVAQSKRTSDGPLCVTKAKGKFENGDPAGIFEVTYSDLDKHGEFSKWEGRVIMDFWEKDTELEQWWDQMKKDNDDNIDNDDNKSKWLGLCPFLIKKDRQGTVTTKNGKRVEATFGDDRRSS